MIDLNNPDAIVLIKDLSRPSDISKVIEKLRAGSYCYAFKHNRVIIKIGMSKDKSKMWGERLYRQIANLPGWPTIPVSSCGKDIIEAVENFEQQTGTTVHKDDCTVEIWLPEETALITESNLLSQYEKLHSCLPPGNFKDTRVKSWVSKKHFSNLFETVL